MPTRRLFLIQLCLAAALAFLPCWGAEAVQPAGSSFTFVHIADTQFGLFESDRSFEAETANFEKVAAEINRLKPAFVVIGGDLVNKTGDPAQIAEFKRILATISPAIPVHLVPGNHDEGNDPTPESVALYRKNIGPTYYTFRYRDFVGIVLDSNIIATPGKVKDEVDAEYAWLADQLQKLKAEGTGNIFVFQHHPYFLQDPGELQNGFLNILPALRPRFYNLLKSSGVTHILAGHTHRFNAAYDGPVSMIATGAVGKPPNGTPSGMSLVTVSPQGVAYKYYTLDQLPISAATRPTGTAR